MNDSATVTNTSPQNRDVVPTTVLLSKATRRRVEKMAKSDGRSLSNQLRVLVDRALIAEEGKAGTR